MIRETQYSTIEFKNTDFKQEKYSARGFPALQNHTPHSLGLEVLAI
jgi:hypothetical protein